MHSTCLYAIFSLDDKNNWVWQPKALSRMLKKGFLSPHNLFDNLFEKRSLINCYW